MDRVPVYVGLDYHQGCVQVCVLNRAGKILVNGAVRNSWEAVAAVTARFGTHVEAAIESCSGAADLADELIAQAGWSVSLAHPGYVARIKQSPDKTDWQDALLLADLVRVGYLPRVWLAPPEVRQLRRLVRFRAQLVAERRSVKLRIRALLREERVQPPQDANAWTKIWLAWLELAAQVGEQTRWVLARHLEQLERLKREIAAVEERLEQATAADPIVRRLRQEKGVGLVTAATLRAEIGRFDRFRTGKQLARFCGSSPRNASSGQRQADAGLVKASNPELRRMLIETAHRLMLHHPRWQQLGKALRARGKPGSVVAAAVANRWIRWLHAQMVSFHVAS